MKINKFILQGIIAIITGCSFSACTENENHVQTVQTKWQTQKVAVVLPMDNSLEVRWKRTLQLLQTNMETAFADQEAGMMLDFEWYNESDAALQNTAEMLSEREDIVAVIGGRSSTSANVLANALCKRGKPFFTLATSEELVRAYSKEQILWAMTETDVSQCEILLTRALYYNAKHVALIAESSSLYGKTFVDWFAFQASELGLEVKSISDYSKAKIKDACYEAFASNANYVVCVPTNKADMKEILQQHHQYEVENGVAPNLLFSDIGYGNDVLQEMGGLAEGIEGVSYCSNPEWGFDVSYEVFYGEPATRGEAQVYDAAMLIAFAAYKQLLNPELDFITAMRELVDGREEGYGAWMANDLREVVNALTQGKHPNLNGASGSLNFDSKIYTNVLHTVYHNYSVYNGKYIILDHIVCDGSKRISDTLAGWNWKIAQEQEFEVPENPLIYPALDKQWAVLIATSSGWANYRHQADVLSMYQLLKANGYTDDRIVLIVEDDIAYNTHNPSPGFISTSPNGENVYNGVHIDYNTSDLTPADIKCILLGVQNERLQEVINSDSDDNILLFWSGHGNYGELNWLDEMDGFSAQMAKQTFKELHDQQRYRKLLCLVETCYSGSVMREVQGFNGILAITAASPYETSKADNYNSSLRIWQSNRFTGTLIESLQENPTISIRDLYRKLNRQTIGSHVNVYNTSCYGSVYENTMSEFFPSRK